MHCLTFLTFLFFFSHLEASACFSNITPSTVTARNLTDNMFVCLYKCTNLLRKNILRKNILHALNVSSFFTLVSRTFKL